MHAKFERLLSKSLTTLEVMAYYLVVHTGPGEGEWRWNSMGIVRGNKEELVSGDGTGLMAVMV